jgi:hypothetical protein
MDCPPGLNDGYCQLDEFWSAPEDCGCPDAPYYPGVYAFCGDGYYAEPSTYNPETELSCPGECSTLTTNSPDKASIKYDQVVWSRRLGGEHGAKLAYFAPDLGRAISVQDRYIYLTGATYSRDFPVTNTLSLPFTSTFNYDWDAFAIKMDTNGNLLASRYLGMDSGFDHDMDTGRGITVGPDGRVFLTGSLEVIALETDFSGFYTQTSALAGDEGWYGIALDSENNIYLAGSAAGGAAKLNPDDSLAYTATLGGRGYDITVDPGGHAYITGEMGVVKLDPFGVQLWSTNLNGTGYGIALHDDLVYAVGGTFSEYFPDTPGAFDLNEDPSGDAFLVVLGANTGEITYGTYLGNDGYDLARDIAVDPWGNAYIVGETHSPDFPVTIDAFDSTLGGFGDAFVAILHPGGHGTSDLLYASYIGGEDPMVPPYNTPDRVFGIALDGLGYVYLTGEAGSADFPTTDTDPVLGFTDLFVMKLDLRDFLDLNKVYLPLGIR